MEEKSKTKQEMIDYLTRIYNTGLYKQDSLFDTEDPNQIVGNLFRYYIDGIAKKTNIKPLELISQLVEENLVKDVFNKLTKIIKTGQGEKAKALYKKFAEHYQHSELEKLTRELFKTQKLTNTGQQGEFQTWEIKGIQYMVKMQDLPMLEGKDPKLYVSQLKNINLLIGLTQEQQYKKEIKEPECDFTLSYYAEGRGYTKEEVQKGGNFYNELKRDLFTGAYTTYKLDKVTINGKRYTAHGIPNFYTLYEPEDKGEPWKVRFTNEPYRTWILNVLNREAKQFFMEDRKAIEDRYTTERPYLYLFYRQLIRRKQHNLYIKPVKVRNLFEEMKLPDKILARPKECFEVLKECLLYFSTHYEPVPEIESYNLYNNYQEEPTVKTELSITEAFKNYTYESYKGLLKARGINDIREAYISFKRPYKKPKKNTTGKQKGKAWQLDNNETRLLDRTLNWFNGQVTKIPREDQESMIKMYIKKLGYDNYKAIFEREANKLNPNAVEFLTKVLPDFLHEDEE